MTRRVDIKFGEDAQTIFVSQGEVKGIPIEDHKVDLVGLADTEFSKRLLAVYLASPEEFPHFRVIIEELMRSGLKPGVLDLHAIATGRRFGATTATARLATYYALAGYDQEADHPRLFMIASNVDNWAANLQAQAAERKLVYSRVENKIQLATADSKQSCTVQVQNMIEEEAFDQGGRFYLSDRFMDIVIQEDAPVTNKIVAIGTP